MVPRWDGRVNRKHLRGEKKLPRGERAANERSRAREDERQTRPQMERRLKVLLDVKDSRRGVGR